MGATVVAVTGTLLGVVVAGGMQYLMALSNRRDQRRQTLTDAVVALLGAATDHRSHQYLKVVARRDGLAETVEARQGRYAARSATTKALTALTVATQNPELLRLGRDLVDASFAIGDAADLDAAGGRARTAHDAFQNSAAHHIHN